MRTGSKEELGERICEFLLEPTGDDETAADEEEAENDEEPEEEEDEEEAPSSEEEPKKKNKGRRNAKDEKPSRTSTGGRPRRSTAGRTRDLSSYVEYSSSDEEKRVRPKPTKKRYKEESDSGSDVSFNSGSAVRQINRLPLL